MPFRKVETKCEKLARINAQKSALNGYKPFVVLSTKSHYVGRWLENKKSGFGKEYFAKAMLYEGHSIGLERNGFGTLRKLKANGCLDVVYEGDWKHNKMHGDGKRYYSNGLYLGKFANGVRSGFGIMWYDEKYSAYMGEWKNDKYHGIGVLFEVNGNRYEGNFENGVKHGEGTYYHLHTGQVQKGIWTKNDCKSSIMQDEFRHQVLHPTPYPITPSKLLEPNQLLRNIFRNQLATTHCFLRESILCCKQ